PTCALPISGALISQNGALQMGVRMMRHGPRLLIRVIVLGLSLLCVTQAAYAVPFTEVGVTTSVGDLAFSSGFIAEQDTGPQSVFGQGVTMSGRAVAGSAGLGAVATVSSDAPANTTTGGISR